MVLHTDFNTFSKEVSSDSKTWKSAKPLWDTVSRQLKEQPLRVPHPRTVPIPLTEKEGDDENLGTFWKVLQKMVLPPSIWFILKVLFVSRVHS